MNDGLMNILKSMDLPPLRIKDLNDSNLLWLARNIMINNRDHPDVLRAGHMIKDLLKERGL
jgi:hypothetical protein